MIDNNYLKSLENLFEDKKWHIKNPLLKFKRMQDIYLSKNVTVYTNTQIESITRCYEAVYHKFFITCLSLEQLWSTSESIRLKIFYHLDNLGDRSVWNEKQMIIGSMLLESFLFQARSFLDIYMKYICHLMGIGDPWDMSTKKFKNKMKSIKDSIFQKKADTIFNYFEDNVFDEEKWGFLLRSLRGKIAHRDFLRPSFDGTEKISNNLLDWPTIQGQTYERLCQNFENKIFHLLIDTSEILFDLKWKSGPYKSEMRFE